ncbi:hypothetical protein [Trichocoleus sp. DQ-U1]|uniref:hypothetical protein n=1 Tax=Trichocoleus sp. DQ-U1 TaxID=2933926 RepID=UPI003297F691
MPCTDQWQLPLNQSGWIQSGVPKSARELGIQARDSTDALQQTNQLQRNFLSDSYRSRGI